MCRLSTPLRSGKRHLWCVAFPLLQVFFIDPVDADSIELLRTARDLLHHSLPARQVLPASFGNHRTPQTTELPPPLYSTVREPRLLRPLPHPLPPPFPPPPRPHCYPHSPKITRAPRSLFCTFYPFTPKSDQFQIFPAALPEMAIHITQYEERGFSWLTRTEDEYTADSHYLISQFYYIPLFTKVGRIYFSNLGVKGLMSPATPSLRFLGSRPAKLFEDGWMIGVFDWLGGDVRCEFLSCSGLVLLLSRRIKLMPRPKLVCRLPERSASSSPTRARGRRSTGLSRSAVYLDANC